MITLFEQLSQFFNQRIIQLAVIIRKLLFRKNIEQHVRNATTADFFDDRNRSFDGYDRKVACIKELMARGFDFKGSYWAGFFVGYVVEDAVKLLNEERIELKRVYLKYGNTRLIEVQEA